MSPKLIFITGATGFVGAHVVDAALAAGYRVRLSIRKPEQAQGFIDRYPEHPSKIETSVISDITKADAFHKALQDVEYVFHIASPMPGAGNDLQKDYVQPAVNGTLAILNAALSHSSIKKVIIDSSALALLPVDALIRNDIVLNDHSNNATFDPNMSFPDNINGHGMKYAASKILAHEASKDWLQRYQPRFILNTLHATFILGNDMNQKDFDGLVGINKLFWVSLFSEVPLIKGSWVSVKDVADAHIKAIENHTTPGQEFVLAQPSSTWEGGMNYIRAKYPGLGCKIDTPLEQEWKVEISVAESELGLKWRSIEDIISDVIEQQLAFKK